MQRHHQRTPHEERVLRRIGQNIHNLRMARGWTQEHVAILSGYCKVSDISLIESGQMPQLPVVRIAAIAAAFDVSLCELLAGL